VQNWRNGASWLCESVNEEVQDASPGASPFCWNPVLLVFSFLKHKALMRLKTRRKYGTWVIFGVYIKFDNPTKHEWAPTHA
jgi:hypothetical protein